MSGDSALPSNVLSRHWRRYLARSLIALLTAKLIALVLMKTLMFPEDQRLDVTPSLVEEQLGITEKPGRHLQGVSP